MNSKESPIKKIRMSKGMTRRELATQSGINFRTLQDYEQGHKSIASARGETLRQLSQVLGCTIEDLLLDDFQEKGIRRLSAYYAKLACFVDRIEEQQIYSFEYKVHGYWKNEDGKWYLTFDWQGKDICLPFEAAVTEQTIPWLADVAVMRIDRYIQKSLFDERYSQEGGDRLHD